jgi:hypothetical protein
MIARRAALQERYAPATANKLLAALRCVVKRCWAIAKNIACAAHSCMVCMVGSTPAIATPAIDAHANYREPMIAIGA